MAVPLYQVRNSFVDFKEESCDDARKRRSLSAPPSFGPFNSLVTLMVRNIPSRFDQHSLLTFIAAHNFRPVTHFDFFYLPIDFKSSKCLGYAFLSFVSAETAAAFKAALSGLAMSSNSSKRLEITFARVQGLEANHNLFSKSAAVKMIDKKFQPLIVSRKIPGAFVPLAQRDDETAAFVVDEAPEVQKRGGLIQAAWAFWAR